MWNILEEVISHAKGWTEIRYHDKLVNSLVIRKGELEESSSKNVKGVGIRVLINGTFGFSSTSIIEKKALLHALDEATTAARDVSDAKQKKIEGLQSAELAKGDFKSEIHDPVTSHSLKEKLLLVRRIEEQTRKSSPLIQSAVCNYTESLDEKYILTSDGARTHILDSKPEFRVTAVASKNGEMQTGSESIGVTGGWEN